MGHKLGKPRSPRRGSLQYWPRKRARRIYPSVHWHAGSGGDVKVAGFAAWKAGMTHISMVDNNSKSMTYGKNITKAVTILDSPSLFVCGLKFYNKSVSGLKSVGEKWFESIPNELELKKKTSASKKKVDIKEGKINNKKIDDVRLIVATQPKKSGMHKRKPDVMELGLTGDDINKKLDFAHSMLGKELNAKDVFKQGEYVDVTAVTKGHGFAGPVKRYGIKIQTRKNEQHHRHVGSIGSVVPRKVDWRVPMAGQYGFFKRTEFNKRILMMNNDVSKVNPKGGIVNYGNVKENFMLVEGSIPGSKKRLVVLRKASRQTKKEVPVEVEYISQESQQG